MSELLNPPRRGTKEARFVTALTSKGKTLSQLSSLMDWQPHTTRAAMTRLRKRGYVIDRLPKTERTAARFKIRRSK
ncbi:MAG: DUF3489 domain-containing protein [Pseudomonadota bacterium]